MPLKDTRLYDKIKSLEVVIGKSIMTLRTQFINYIKIVLVLICFEVCICVLHIAVLEDLVFLGDRTQAFACKAWAQFFGSALHLQKVYQGLEPNASDMVLAMYATDPGSILSIPNANPQTSPGVIPELIFKSEP